VRLLYIILFTTIVNFGTALRAQVKARDVSIGIDYSHLYTGTWNNIERRGFALSGEYAINDMFSAEVYYSFDGNGYAPFSYAVGTGVDGFWGRRFSHIYQDAYIGGRLYPIDNFHSQALALRNKEPYGFYFAYGWRMSHYQRHEFLLEENYGWRDNDGDGEYDEQYLESVQFDRFGYNLTQWGVNFGAGWKQYHSKFMYTDMSIYSDVYTGREINYYYDTDDDFGQSIVPQVWYGDFIDFVESVAKNGQGIELRLIIGINLDFRK